MSHLRFGMLCTLSAGLVLAMGARGASAQSALKDHVAAAKQSLQQSQAALRHFEWVETTAISLKGEEKSRIQNTCYYGADGNLQKVLIGAPPKKKKGLRGKIAENKKEEISAEAQKAVALLKSYVPPEPQRIQAAKDGGKLLVAPPDAHGNVRLIINDYLKAGDSLTIEMNAATDRITGVSVSSYVDAPQDAVDLSVTFGAFPDGTVYPQMTNLAVKSQNLGVTVENSGYKKLPS